MWAVPLDFLSLCVGFALFRLFDIVKPWPIRWFDRNIHGGLGIMLDDIVAGILACAVMHSVWLPFIH
jgi:phosphatidylglycerophosphatase A